MNDELRRPGSSRTPASRRRRFRRRELDLADGSRLVLKADGSIDHVDDGGDTKQSWTPDDPEWPRHAIRFGLRPQNATVAPHGRYVERTKPPY